MRDERNNIQRKQAKEQRKLKKYTDKMLLELSNYRPNYPSNEHSFNSLHYQFSVADDRLAAALKALPTQKRDIIFLAYYLDMTDQEIASALNMFRGTVQRQRQLSLQKLKQHMEDEDEN